MTLGEFLPNINENIALLTISEYGEIKVCEYTKKDIKDKMVCDEYLHMEVEDINEESDMLEIWIR